MPTTPIAPPEALSTLPGATVLLRLRRLLVLGAVAAVVYSVVLQASRGYCADPTPSRGAVATLSDVCVTLTLGPSPLVYAALAAIVIAALGRVLRRTTTVSGALAVLDRAAIALMVVAGASVVIAYVWFFLIPIENWGSGGTLWYPFPFATVDLTSSPG